MKVQKIKEFPINGQDSTYLVKLLEDVVYEIDHIIRSRRGVAVQCRPHRY